MRNKFHLGLRTLYGIVVALVLVALVPTTAEAKSSTSHSFSAWGTTYTYGGSLNVYSTKAEAIGYVSATNAFGAGSAYLVSRVYRDGSLLASNASTNATARTYFSLAASASPGAGGLFTSSHNTCSIYGGSGVGYKYFAPDPLSLVWTSSNSAVTGTVASFGKSFPFSYNEKGEMLGSLLDAEKAGVIPDLVKAIGQHGIEGYVKYSDVACPCPSNPQEALELYSHPATNAVGVYDSDGVTQLDTFLVHVGYADDTASC